jgi:hypothetical protein
MRVRWLAWATFGIGLLCVAILAPRLGRSLPGPPAGRSAAGEALIPLPPETPMGSVPPRPATEPRLKVPPGASGATVRPGSSYVPKQRGVSLGLFAEDVSFDYSPLLAEIAALGATHVQLVVPIYQEHAGSTSLRLHTRFSPNLSATAEAVRAARRAGLEVMLFPIVRLSAPRRPGEWRGTLKPEDPDAWFESYGEILGDLAALGAMTGAARLAVGSELSSLDADVPRWSQLIERMRALFPGPLVYSANWDRYKKAKVFDLVDEAGVVAYFELRAPESPSDVAVLERRWRELRAELEAWRAGRAQPFVFTEVGYRSRAGASAAPWDERPGGTPDAEEQRRAFEAFRRAWTAPAAASLAGLYVWNWYGYGGPDTLGYTPRGKPAAEEVRRLLGDL